MIKVSKELIDSYIDSMSREPTEEIFNRLIKDIGEENPHLYEALISTVVNNVNYILEVTGSLPEDSVKVMARNMIFAALHVYNVLKQQMIVNELEG